MCMSQVFFITREGKKRTKVMRQGNVTALHKNPPGKIISVPYYEVSSAIIDKGKYSIGLS